MAVTPPAGHTSLWHQRPNSPSWGRHPFPPREKEGNAETAQSREAFPWGRHTKGTHDVAPLRKEEAEQPGGKGLGKT